MLFNPCGFEQKYDLPCPTCGFTTAAIAFAEGRIFASFYIQPAAALFSVIIVITAIFSLITAVFGLYFRFLVNLAGRIKLRYIFLLILLIIIAGWSVTLARALAKNG
ncbi:MAG: DUF2752 domain-containing protein [Phycisphaerae bacterium]|nr:DUF2752 domain-containing protein [Phycisphaerae bacterium]